MRLAIRTDASCEIGAGHAVRCITLAKALQHACSADNITLDIVIVSTVGASMMNQAFADEGFKLTEVSHIQSDVSHVGADIWVIDHYQLDTTFETSLVNSGAIVVVIDDLADRQHNCHVLIDGNLTRNITQRYSKLVSQECIQLIGPRYALLRDEFYRARRQCNPRQPNHVFICFGGSDPTNMTSVALEALTKVKELNLTADVVIGTGHRNKQAIIEQTKLLHGVTVHVDSKNMAELMCKASLMIGAGGSMHWERCICDLYGLIITIADNQREATECLASINACEYLGNAPEVSSEVIADRLSHFFAEGSVEAKIPNSLNEIVPLDGGASHVSEKILTILKGKKSKRGTVIENH